MPYTKKKKSVASLLKAYRAKKASASKRRKTSYKSKGNVGKATSLIRTGGRSVKVRSVNELKDVTVLFNALVGLATTAATINLLNGIAQGVASGERIGRKVTMKSLFLRGYFSYQGATTGSVPIRVLIVYDNQTNAVAPVATDIVLQDTIVSPMNLGNAQRFKVLYDHVFNMGQNSQQTINFQKYIKLNHEITYNTGATNTVGSIQTGSVYLLVWTNGGLAGSVPAHNVWSRIRFVD